MRAVIQRVLQASVTVEEKVVAEIGLGYLILLGITHNDGETEAQYGARKIAGLRLFEDDGGKMKGKRVARDLPGAYESCARQ